MSRPPRAKAIVVGVVVWLATMAAACGNSRSSVPVSYNVKDIASSTDVSTEALRGRPAVLTSWTTWCKECDEELAALQAFAGSPGAEGVAVVAVNLDSGDVTDEIMAKIDRHGLTTSLWRDRRNEFKHAFGALGVPTTVVLDTGGTVVGLFPGVVHFGEPAVLGALEKARAADSP